MAPVRRYLRISKYSVLECRIYLSNPGDERWLESRSTIRNESDSTVLSQSVLERIFQAVRPLVLPKLREENIRRANGKKRNNAPVKDVLIEDDFEVTIFLRETGSRHSLVTRKKTFSAKSEAGADVSAPIQVEEDEEGGLRLEDIPVADAKDANDNDQESTAPSVPPRRSRRSRRSEPSSDVNEPGESEDPAINQRDDKKLTMRTTYDGFSIWGWILCLLVTRRSHSRKAAGPAHRHVKGTADKPSPATGSAEGQALMEEWISTQAAQELADED